MKERASWPMKDFEVQAILEGRKTQARRIVKPQPYIDGQGNFCWNGRNFGQDFNGPHIQEIASPIPSSKTKRVHCPFGKPGDRLWVREAHAEVLLPDIPIGRFIGPQGTSGIPARPEWPSYVIYRADGEMPNVQWHCEGDSQPVRWTPSTRMPRWASRILLEITAVRIERLNDISEDDALAEGVTFKNPVKPGHASRMGREAFAELWQSINGPDSWDENPWVWVIEFERVKS